MAYQTNTFSPSDDLSTVQSILKTFAVAEGWTLDHDSFPNLSLHKNGCFVNLIFDDTTHVDDTQNTGSSVADQRLTAYLADSYPSVAWPHSISVNNGLERPVFNDLTPPYSKYWLFSGAGGDPDYVWMVIQLSNGRFSMFGFGTLDKKGVTYDGGDFVTGVFYHWFFPSGTPAPTGGNGSNAGSDPFSTNHGWPGDQSQGYNLRLGDVNPTRPFTSQAAGNGSITQYSYGLNSLMLRGSSNPTALESWGTINHKWIGHNYWLGPNPINGVSPLHEIIYQYVDGYNAGGRLVAMGSLPGYRGLSMIGRTEAEEITFGSDTWIVFPIKKYLPYLPEPYSTKTITSGPYGHAFKVNT